MSTETGQVQTLAGAWVVLSNQPALTMSFSLTVTEARHLSTEQTGLYRFATTAVRFPLPRTVKLQEVHLVDHSGRLVNAWVAEAGFFGEAEDLQSTGIAELSLPVEGYRPRTDEVWFLLQLFNTGTEPDTAFVAGPFTASIRYSVLGFTLTREFTWDPCD